MQQKYTAIFFVGMAFGLASTASAEPSKVYSATLKCDIASAIQEAGVYAVVTAENLDNWRFPKPKFCEEGKNVKVMLVPLKQDTPAPEVLSMLRKKGLRAAESPDLLALAGRHPELQSDARIFALGSAKISDVGYMEYATPFLGIDEKGRRILSLWKGPECPAGYVAAVRM